MKKIIILLLVFSSHFSQSQQKNKLPYEFGRVTQEELKLELYPKDETASALVLYEHGNVSVHGSGSSKLYFVNKVYKKVKIFNEQGYDKGTVKVYLYKGSSGGSEKIKNIKAVTYNTNENRTILGADHIHRNELNDRYDEVSFTFPNLKPGSVLEYQYEIESEYFFNLVGWSFQSDIPKLHSEFHATIPGFWNYNRHLNGSLSLTKNEALLEKDCFELGGARASCEDLTYAITDVPAFKEEEKYSLAEKNYISKIEFELARINYPDGRVKQYTSTWAATDQYLARKESIGKQLKLSSYFKKNLPKELLSIKDDYQKAKSIFYYIQNHFTLDNDKKSIFNDVNAKKAYELKQGSVAEINIALINALESAGLTTKIMLLSTRDNGIPTKTHPIMTDFNYVIVYLSIDSKIVLLDASDQFMTFGQTPFETLNGQGRVLDFKNGSFWYSLSPKIASEEIREISMNIEEEGSLNWEVLIKSQGYDAASKRERIDEMSQDDYLDYLEIGDNDILVDSYSNQQLNELDSILVERFSIKSDYDQDIPDATIYLNPFLYRFKNNPFTLKDRAYPVNFGYKINKVTKTSIELPSGYRIKSLPENVHIKLPNQGGAFITSYTEKDNKILVYSSLRLNYSVYVPEKYTLLKELFKEIIKTNNSLISLEKTSGS